MNPIPVLFAGSLLNGVLYGGLWGLAAVGLSLIFGIQRILNVAQGAFILLASFITFQFSLVITPMWHLDPLYSIILDFFLLGGVGAASYFLLIYKIENTGFEAPLVATFGLAIFLEYVMSSGLVFGNVTIIHALDTSGGNGALVQHQTFTSDALSIGPISSSWPLIIAFVLAITAVPLVHLFLTKTYYGRSIRAMSQDREAAEFSGIDIRVARMMSFTLGSALAGIAGGIYAFTTPIIPTQGDTVVLPIILAVIVLGGVGSMIGTLFGGLVVGLIIWVGDFFASAVLGQFNFQLDFGTLIAYLAFLAVLMVRPSGLFGVSLRK
jgi:branched-chain amino acid transport system permease protein